MTRSNFWLFFVCLFSVTLIISGCKKTFLDQQEPLEQASILAGSGNITIDMQDVLTAMPQTLLYNMGSDFKLYAGRSEWVFKEHALQVRIPTTEGYGNYIYALKYYDQPNSLHIYAVTFLPDAGSSWFDTNFNGKQEWINFQDWHLYSVTYTDGIVTGHSDSLKLADPNWESCALENGLFFINNAGDFEMIETASSTSSGISPLGGPQDLKCPRTNAPDGFFVFLGKWFGKVFGGNWIGDPGDQYEYPPGDGYGSWGFGWPGYPGGPSNEGNTGGGTYTPPVDPPPANPNPIWESVFKPLDVGYANIDNEGNDGNFYIATNHWGVPTDHGSVIINDNELVQLLVNILGLDEDGRDWLLSNPTKAFKISEFIIAHHPDLTLHEILDIAREHLRLMMEESEYESFIDNFPGNWWDRDQDDFMYSRIKALEIYVQANPYGLLDCNDIDNLPMVTLQDVGSHQVPASILSRIQDIINDNHPAYTNGNTFIQDINDGVGVVNMDFFPVRIAQLPKNDQNQTMTPLEFLETFRKNLTPTFTNGHASTFHPLVEYVAGSIDIDETNLFNSADENALGSLITIHIPLWYPAQNNGTVVLSDYKKDVSSDHYSFTFTTMSTKYDGEHPLAGNRRFGINPHPSGGYQFYTLGVDRVWSFPANWPIIRDFAFNAADGLWTQVQDNMINYVNSKGGVASYFPDPNRKARVKWEGAIKPYLMGEINYEELRNVLNCP